MSKRRRRRKTKPTTPPHGVIALGKELWTLARQADSWTEGLGERRRRRAENQIAWAKTQLENILAREQLVFRDLTGEVWDEGEPVEIVNPPVTRPPDTQLRVETMLSPVILYQGRVVEHGKISISIEERSPS